MKNDEKKKNLMVEGIPASPGIVIGEISLVDKHDFDIPARDISEDSISDEIIKFEDALKSTREEILNVIKSIENDLDLSHAKIFNAHLLLLEDRMLIEEVIKEIKEKKQNVEYIFYQVLQKFIATFNSTGDEYIKERVADIKDVGKRVLRNLLGQEMSLALHVKDEVIIAAYDIAPSDMAMINRKKVKGFVTDIGSRTSHTAIVARSLEIPAVVGLQNITSQVQTGDIIIIDGDKGCIIIDPSKETIEDYEGKIGELAKFTKKLEQLKDLPAVTKDGVEIDLVANIEFTEDINSVLLHGANGIGLYRTEFFYMNRMDLPTEDEHFEAYKQVAESMKPHSVVVRTLDLGGDKFLSLVEVPHEMNPFLGWRAIRFCLERLDIFKVQLRAILRASVYGNLQIMYPLISGVEEFRKANKVLAEVKQSLDDSGIPYDKDIKVGAMIEVPSAAMTADILAKEADFFSIGTNDLIQYSLAVDRVNEKIAYLYEPTHPAIIRFVKMIIDAGHKEGIPVAMCGEMTGDALYAPLLLGLGLDEFSVSPVVLPEIKMAIRSISKKDAEKLVEKVLKMTTAEEIEHECRKYISKVLPEKRI